MVIQEIHSISRLRRITLPTFRSRASPGTHGGRHPGTCQGGGLNSRPRAYESPALPLSSPGVVWHREEGSKCKILRLGFKSHSRAGLAVRGRIPHHFYVGGARPAKRENKNGGGRTRSGARRTAAGPFSSQPPG